MIFTRTNLNSGTRVFSGLIQSWLVLVLYLLNPIVFVFSVAIIDYFLLLSSTVLAQKKEIPRHSLPLELNLKSYNKIKKNLSISFSSLGQFDYKNHSLSLSPLRINRKDQIIS